MDLLCTWVPPLLCGQPGRGSREGERVLCWYRLRQGSGSSRPAWRMCCVLGVEAQDRRARDVRSRGKENSMGMP